MSSASPPACAWFPSASNSTKPLVWCATWLDAPANRLLSKPRAKPRNSTRPSPKSYPIPYSIWSATRSTTGLSQRKRESRSAKIQRHTFAFRLAISRARSSSPFPTTVAAWIARRSSQKHVRTDSLNRTGRRSQTTRFSNSFLRPDFRQRIPSPISPVVGSAWTWCVDTCRNCVAASISNPRRAKGPHFPSNFRSRSRSSMVWW